MLVGDTKFNKNGGIYQRGKRYDLTKKQAVALEYLKMATQAGSTRVSISKVAKQAKVGWKFANKVVKEYEQSTTLRDPKDEHKEQVNNKKGKRLLTIEEEVFLLALRAEDPTRTNLEYIQLLQSTYGRLVSSTFISTWFKKRFQFPGDFKKPSVVPLDKWRPINVARYVEFKCLMDALPLHHLWCFLDEKHIVNKDTIRDKCRADPLTGKMDYIPVSGDFRETFNLMAVVSLNPEKEKLIEYHIDKDTNDASMFVAFVENLVQSNYLRHNEVLVLDNAAIHVGGPAACIRELLWNTVIDGRPLRILVIFLPTRSPELNPIELIFHILSKRIKSSRYKGQLCTGQDVIQKTAKVLDEIEYEVIMKCFVHCGY